MIKFANKDFQGYNIRIGYIYTLLKRRGYYEKIF